MKTPLTSALFACLVIAFTGCGQQEPSAGKGSSAVQPARQTSFAEVTSQLDPGGNVYVYLATDQWLRGLSTNVAQFQGLLTNLPDMSPSDRENVGRVLNSVTRIIERSGIENLTGVGLSGVQVTPELHRAKFILHHAKGQDDVIINTFPEKWPPYPDLPPTVMYLAYPSYYVEPFHYPNPVTGNPMPPPDPKAGGMAFGK